ncbi:MAG: hypothetical protein IH602_09620 [Bryobacteraceae bacterium]|nr:hypothetical protein [Bryobacteraceae bacterium]
MARAPGRYARINTTVQHAWNPNLAALLAAAGILLAAALWIIFRRRLSPEEKERRRRLTVNAYRRAIEGVVDDADGDFIHFQYHLRGVTYSASQDVSALAVLLPENRGMLLGTASIRFDPRNPANSIVVCEEWSGLRNGTGGAAIAVAQTGIKEG